LLTKKHHDERNAIESSFKGAAQNFVICLRKHFGPMVGLARYISTHNVGRPTWELFTDMIHKAENETDLYASTSKAEYLNNEPYRAVIAVSDSEFTVWRDSLLGTRVELIRAEIKNIKKQAAEIKPEVLIVSAKHLTEAKALHRRWPFLPL